MGVTGDPFVVDQLKTHFQRLRPSDILNTYAFPSGHTTAAVFIMGNMHLPVKKPLSNSSSLSMLSYVFVCVFHACTCRAVHLATWPTARHQVAQLSASIYRSH